MFLTAKSLEFDFDGPVGHTRRALKLTQIGVVLAVDAA